MIIIFIIDSIYTSAKKLKELEEYENKKKQEKEERLKKQRSRSKLKPQYSIKQQSSVNNNNSNNKEASLDNKEEKNSYLNNLKTKYDNQLSNVNHINQKQLQHKQLKTKPSTSSVTNQNNNRRNLSKINRKNSPVNHTNNINSANNTSSTSKINVKGKSITPINRNNSNNRNPSQIKNKTRVVSNNKYSYNSNSNNKNNISKHDESHLSTYSNNNTNNTNNSNIQLTSKGLIENLNSKYANKRLNEKEMEFHKKSNKSIIKNAITSVCLGGNTNSICRNKILEVIDNCSCDSFVILFKDNIGRKVSYAMIIYYVDIIILFQDLRAIYTYNPSNCKVELLTCVIKSPIELEEHMIVSFYKYDNAKKEFKVLSEIKKFYQIVDAVSLKQIQNNYKYIYRYKYNIFGQFKYIFFV